MATFSIYYDGDLIAARHCRPWTFKAISQISRSPDHRLEGISVGLGPVQDQWVGRLANLREQDKIVNIKNGIVDDRVSCSYGY